MACSALLTRRAKRTLTMACTRVAGRTKQRMDQLQLPLHMHNRRLCTLPHALTQLETPSELLWM